MPERLRLMDPNDIGDISKKDLLTVCSALILRVQRLEETVGQLINMTLLRYVPDQAMPSDETIMQTLDQLAQTREEIAREIDKRHQYEAEIEFLNQPE